jgi:two-component system, NtrC family, sensor kinase
LNKLFVIKDINNILMNKATLLIVDDEPEILSVMGQILAPLYTLRAANSGERALIVARTQPLPDLILLDVMMPDMDGYSVLSQLKKNPITQDIPVIFVTAMRNFESEEKGLDLGAIDYITKPVNAAILLARVKTHLTLKLAHDFLLNKNDYLESEVARRLTEREQVEKEIEKTRQQYYHQEKIATIGAMVAGVLHEIGNPVSSLSGIIEHLQSLNNSVKIKLDKSYQKQSNYYLNLLSEHVNRLIGITKEVSNFVSPQIEELDVYDLNNLIIQNKTLLRFDSQLKSIDIKYSLDHSIPAVYGIQSHAVQIFLNVMINAAHACDAANKENPFIYVSTTYDKGFVILSIADNGIGMSEEVQNKALQPFFTTKMTGKGTGLGLSLCHSLLEGEKGNLIITSIEGVGTEISVYIPEFKA